MMLILADNQRTIAEQLQYAGAAVAFDVHEIKIILFNFGAQDFVIKRGDRIAQLILSKVSYAKWETTEKISKSKRGKGGFGHTGKN